MPGAVAPATPAVTTVSREAALAASPRVRIDSPDLLGSINLKGARIDDVILRNYDETVNPDSPKVVLLSPSGSPHPYFALTGWLGQPGVVLPSASTLWEQEGTGPLTATHPVVLRYDNGQGLVFRRTFSVDDHYMFTVADEVENKAGQPVTLTPWGQVARLTEPKTSGYSVLHEGLIAGLGKDGTKDFTYSAALKNYEAGGAKETFTDAGGWAGFTDQYWATVLIPDSKDSVSHSDVRKYGKAVLRERAGNAAGYNRARRQKPSRNAHIRGRQASYDSKAVSERAWN